MAVMALDSQQRAILRRVVELADAAATGWVCARDLARSYGPQSSVGALAQRLATIAERGALERVPADGRWRYRPTVAGRELLDVEPEPTGISLRDALARMAR